MMFWCGMRVNELAESIAEIECGKTAKHSLIEEFGPSTRTVPLIPKKQPIALN